MRSGTGNHSIPAPLAHTHQNWVHRKYLKPITHAYLPKAGRVTDPREVQDPTTKALCGGLLYTDPEVALLRRSQGDAIMPTTFWLHIADP